MTTPSAPSTHHGSASVAVVGAGISGLAAAQRLRTLLGPRAQITVLEQSARIGGVLRTVELAGRGFDVGAEAFLTRRPEVPALLAELGLAEQLVHPAAVPASVLAGGRPHGLPPRSVMGIPSSVDSVRGLLSDDALRQVAAEPERPLRWEPGSDVAVGQLVRERLGAEVVARSVDPLLGGVYSGSADSLGLRAAVPAVAAALDAGAPSLTAAAAQAAPQPQPGVPVFGALREGYTSLLEALREAAAARLRTGCTVTAVGTDATGWWVDTADAGRERFDAVVLAVPAPAARRLLTDVAPRAAHAAAGIPLASCVVVGLAYDGEQVDAQLPPTSGLLVATGEALHAKAFTHSSRKWPHLGGDGVLRLRASLGRYGDAAALQVDDATLLAQVRADLEQVHGITAVPLGAVVQRWGGGLPQYGPGHLDRVAEIEDAVAAVAGLAVAGSMLHGVGVPACIATGRAAAERVVQHVTTCAEGSTAVAR
ncbi:protoporphyrinogen oxidase [Rhodococcus sp. X156]|uniref:protoporphyrinogen oxidase n=1 Tax=Rhodococcus sp. X156 TaxID=2499145 RepID=UPI000FD9C6A1|nr:protoporphyrinogen oxidase [Rhodococcus sp. X156]